MIYQRGPVMCGPPTLRSDWLMPVVSCGVIGRDGAVDLQVQGGGHGGLLPADLRPGTERADRRCQVTYI